MTESNKELEFNFSWEQFFTGCVRGAECQDCQRMHVIQMSSEFNKKGVIMTSELLMQHCYYIVGKAECYKNWKKVNNEVICSNAEKLIQLWKNNTLKHYNRDGCIFEKWVSETKLANAIQN